MLEFTIGDHLYRARKLNTFQQMHVLRRIGPIIAPMFTAQATPGEEGPAAQVKQVATFLEALGKMTDEDCDFVVRTCAGAVQRQQGSNGSMMWADIFNPRANAFMFDDIDNLGTMLEVTGTVLRDNLSGFLSTRAAEPISERPRPEALALNG